MHTGMHACRHAYIHIYMYTCIRTYIHTFVHTYVRILCVWYRPGLYLPFKCTLSARISCGSLEWILGCVVLCETAYDVLVVQLLQILSSLIVEHSNSSAVAQPFSKLVSCSGGAQQHHLGHLKQNREFFYRLLWAWSSKYAEMFICHFEIEKLFCAHSVYLDRIIDVRSGKYRYFTDTKYSFGWETQV
jgi:hypothetical protein